MPCGVSAIKEFKNKSFLRFDFSYEVVLKAGVDVGSRCENS